MSKVAVLLLLGLLVVSSSGRTLLQGYGSIGDGSGTSGGGGGGGGSTITIDPWTLGQNFADQTASVGDTITFTWNQGTHGVYRIPDGNCPSSFQNGQNGQTEIQAATAGPQTVTYTFDQAGTYWFACPVDGHCDGGMKLKVTVS